MSLLYRAAALGFGGAAATTGTYAGVYYMKRERPSVAEHLKSSGYKLIFFIENSDNVKLQWKEEFKSDRENIKLLIGFTGSSDENGGKALEKWCASRLNEEYSENLEGLEGVKNYCVLRTIDSQLSRNKKGILADNDSDKWNKTYDKRKATTTLSPRSQIGLSGEWGQRNDSKNADLPLIKDWCKTQSQSYFLAYQKTYTNVYNWCTEDGASVTQ
ncbi:hypothetical protein HF1_04400 [Mycoplasma haemofelis str. Langford 1]|uniref:Uncharacterized protein n=2 Tax=Mycoplasma haemofelis TaxID=29501 RepID=F6FHL5_MYCHI|nr:hypothetical protein [Mycoplasma haemofelis]AEG72754.1 hypothetical protein MHF_0482 [Mycoplasma haemofelis Ohio2]CBY92448.1 hypothetical protein HF1_04400 [Mycoplasma haemofelis str. Langford 1]